MRMRMRESKSEGVEIFIYKIKLFVFTLFEEIHVNFAFFLWFINVIYTNAWMYKCLIAEQITYNPLNIPVTFNLWRKGIPANKVPFRKP